MPRARWFVAGFLVLAAVIGGLLNERGPFDTHPVLAYDRFLADVAAGRVERIARWRDQLEVTEDGRLLSVTVPPDRDFAGDLAQAHAASGVGLSYRGMPDAWLGLFTPWIPLLILAAAILIWSTAIIRARRATLAPPG